MVEIIALVLENRRFAQDGKSVGKALGDEELAVIVFRELDSHVLSVGRASLADVYRHIEHGSSDTTYQLALCIRRTLEMQSAHHPVGRHAFIVLHEADRFHFFIELPLRERLEEIASRILEDSWLDDDHAFYCCLDYFHSRKNKLADILPFQDGTMCQVIGRFGIDKDDTSPFDGIDDGLGQVLRNGRTTETSSQTTGRTGYGRVGVCRTVYHDGTLAGTVVDSFLQAV